MKKCLLGLWMAVICLSLPAALPALDTGDHIEFTLQFNSTADNRSSYEDGYGLWVGYQRDMIPFLSLGGEVGVHQFKICNCGIGLGEDTITSVPVLLAANLHFTFADFLTVFGEAGVGGSFNFIQGDGADLFDLKLDPSLAFDLRVGALLELFPNTAIGVSFDCFVSQASVSSNSPAASDSVNLGHYGTGVVVIVSF